jgi:hypothetical protein
MDDHPPNSHRRVISIAGHCWNGLNPPRIDNEVHRPISRHDAPPQTNKDTVTPHMIPPSPPHTVIKSTSNLPRGRPERRQPDRGDLKLPMIMKSAHHPLCQWRGMEPTLLHYNTAAILSHSHSLDDASPSNCIDTVLYDPSLSLRGGRERAQQTKGKPLDRAHQCNGAWTQSYLNEFKSLDLSLLISQSFKRNFLGDNGGGYCKKMAPHPKSCGIFLEQHTSTTHVHQAPKTLPRQAPQSVSAFTSMIHIPSLARCVMLKWRHIMKRSATKIS